MQDDSPSFKSLHQHYHSMANLHMRDLFIEDRDRFSKFSLDACGLFLDYSKNRILTVTMDKLYRFAEYSKVPEAINGMFSGQLMNATEERPALHTALRNFSDSEIYVDGENILTDVRLVLEKIAKIVNALHRGEWLGFSQKPITDVVNIGIGGSDLGPALVTCALTPFHKNILKVHFVSNIDGAHLTEVLKFLSPETTLFIIASKSFTTQETLHNTISAQKWLLKSAASHPEVMRKHFIAVTAYPDKAIEFGIHSEHILPIWEWVGGRFSVWSAIGLSIAIAIGMENFKEFLAGAHAMDQHFKNTSLEKNMPVVLALLSIWYINFFKTKTFAILPYDQYLHLLPAYLQQAEMESNGKSTKINGENVKFQTSPVVFGMVGCNGQHAFHQLFHQGTQLIPTDFILPMQAHHDLPGHHELLVANCFSQSKSLMMGKTITEVKEELRIQGLTQERVETLAPHKVLPGNRPSNTILLPKQTPFHLGALLALYEHKIFVQGALWQINSFDQWGVEFGKKITSEILAELQSNKKPLINHDDSTMNLIERYRNHRIDPK